MKQKIKNVFSIEFLPSNIFDPPVYIPKADRVAIYTFANMFTAALVHPLDYIKTRIQTTSFPYTPVRIAKRIYRLEGPIAFTYGTRATLLRQFLSNGTRVCTYVYLYDWYKRTYGEKANMKKKLQIGIVAGMAGAFLGNPADIILYRTMAASAPRAYNGCPDLQALINNRYKGNIDAVRRIIKEEGVRALWRGASLGQVRSVFFTLMSIGGYTCIASGLKKKCNMREGYFLHTVTSLISTFVLCVVTVPIDVVKSRYQIARRGVTKMEVFKRIVRVRGPLFFWKRPLAPYYIRQALHLVVSFFISEEIEWLYRGDTPVQKRLRKEEKQSHS